MSHEGAVVRLLKERDAFMKERDALVKERDRLEEKLATHAEFLRREDWPGGRALNSTERLALLNNSKERECSR